MQFVKKKSHLKLGLFIVVFNSSPFFGAFCFFNHPAYIFDMVAGLVKRIGL